MADKMRIQIAYCVEWDYYPRAASVAEEILTSMPDQVSELALTPSGSGTFDVTVDGDLVFSKKQVGRHANPGEVKGLVEGKL